MPLALEGQRALAGILLGSLVRRARARARTKKGQKHMKRDMDLVRKILLAIEEEHDRHSAAQVKKIEGYPDDQVHYHV